MPRARVRRIYRQLSDSERGRIIGKREAGLSFRKIADRTNRNPNTVRRCGQACFDNGQNRRTVGTGLRRVTNYLVYLITRIRSLVSRARIISFVLCRLCSKFSTQL